jgi:hypothetical protein
MTYSSREPSELELTLIKRTSVGEVSDHACRNAWGLWFVLDILYMYICIYIYIYVHFLCCACGMKPSWRECVAAIGVIDHSFLLVRTNPDLPVYGVLSPTTACTLWHLQDVYALQAPADVDDKW